jgi:hypothetical protein
MKIFGRPLFGWLSENPIVPIHYDFQNLDRRPGDEFDASGSILRSGRGWIYTYDRRTISLEWSFDFSHALLCFEADGVENNLGVSLAIPPMFLSARVDRVPESIFRMLGLRTPGSYSDMEKEVRFSFSDGSFRWSIWNPVHHWDSKWPWYRSGTVTPMDAVFGQAVSKKTLVSEEAVLIPMPERTYRATMKTERISFRRPRWPLAKELLTFHIEMEEGEQIPIPGKGENSWDCDDDAVFSLSTSALSGDGAIGNLVTSVLRSRRRHGGSRNWRPDPPAIAPEVTA